MTILLSLCYLDEPGRLNRNLKYLEYYRPLKAELGFDHIVLIDNASSMENLKLLGGTIIDAQTKEVLHVGASDLTIHRFSEHLPRISMWDIPYCWRGFEHTKELLTTASKIIAIDSDVYVLTKRLATFIKDCNSGWVSMWCQKYGFAETSLWVLNSDSFHLLKNFPVPSYSHYASKSFEEWIPFSRVEKGFTGDRYGEEAKPQDATMDYYCQWHPTCGEMKYETK